MRSFDQRIFAVTIQVGLFWVFNTVVPFTDVGTDYFTFLDLLRDGHIMWATLTFVVMWNPFLIHLGVFLFGLLQNKIYGSEFEAAQKVKDIAYHLPFVLPFKNLFTAARLGLMQFGSSAFDNSNWELVEQIQHEAGVAGVAGVHGSRPPVGCPTRCDPLHGQDQPGSVVFHPKQSAQSWLGVVPCLLHPTWRGRVGP